MKFSDDLKVKEALELYFKNSGFDAKSYTENWASLPVGPFKVFFPNIKARKKVLPLHDVSHILTDYGTDWKGEMEITGFELARGFGNHWIGWVIDLKGIWLAVLLCPWRTFKAYARGRRSGCLYERYESTDPLMEKTLGELRKELPIVPEDFGKTNFSDHLSYLSIFVLSVFVHLIPLSILSLTAYFLFFYKG